MTAALPARLLVVLLSAALPATAEEALPVEIVTVAPVVSSYDYVLTGTAEATNLTPLSFRAGGRVIEVLVDQGDPVEAGTVIARVDPTQQREALRAARAGLQAADAGLVRAQQDYDRQKALLDRGTVTQAEFDASREGLVTATSSRDQAQAQVVRAERALDDTELSAPTDAIVTERFADPGQVVGAAQTIVTLADRVGRDAVFLAPDGAPVEAFLGAEISLAQAEKDLAAAESEIDAGDDSDETHTRFLRATAQVKAARKVG
jgi:RND family efflux transporter MFP subunit